MTLTQVSIIDGVELPFGVFHFMAIVCDLQINDLSITYNFIFFSIVFPTITS